MPTVSGIDPFPVRASETPTNTRWQAAADMSLVVVLVFVVYSPVLMHRYGYMDDFWMYFHSDDMKTPYFSAGRPVVGLAWLQIHDFITNVGQLAWLRLFAVVGACGIACQIYWLTRPVARTRVSRMSLAVSVAALPGLTVLVAWATCWMYPFAAVFGLGAAAVAHSAIRLWRRQRSSGVIGLVLSTGLLFVGLGIYQPGGSWYWTVPFINVLDRRFLTNARYRTRIVISFALGIVQFTLAYLAFKMFFALSGVTPQDRAVLVHEPLSKLTSLLRIQLPLVLSQWQVLDTARKPLMITIAAIIATIILCACLVQMRERSLTAANARQSQTRWFLWWSMLIATAAMSHVHWWVLNYNAKNYRTTGALAACVTVALWWSVWKLVPLLFTPQWQTRMSTRICLGLALFALTKCGVNLHRFWIHPYVTAYTFTVDELVTNISPGTNHIHMIRQSPDEGIVAERNIYNFGRPFSDFDWAIEGLIRAALVDASVGAEFQTITHGLGNDPIPQGPGVAVIDMRGLVRFRENQRVRE